MPTLTNLKPGDVLIAPNDQRTNLSDYMPRIVNALFHVERVTPTQAVCMTYLAEYRSGSEVRVKLADGQIIGGRGFERVRLATPQEVDAHRAALQARSDYQTAMRVVDDLIDQPFHRLKLSLRQIEALAQAWQTIKIMKS